MKKAIVLAVLVSLPLVAQAAFNISYQSFNSGVKFFATNSDDRAHTCNISYSFTTENSSTPQAVNMSATAHPGINNVVIAQTWGGWSRFQLAGEPRINCN